MTRVGTELLELSREECLALLPTVPVGRVLFTQRALPAIVPVNFVVDSGSVVIRTSAGSSLAAALPGSVLAFEVDDFHSNHRNGWTVTVLGRSRAVDDPVEHARMRSLPLDSYVGTDLDQYLLIPIEMISGRRVGPGPL